MKLYLLRHGQADWADWQGSDDERPLNPEGLREMERVADGLERLGVRPGAILSSPLPRARKTAEIAAERLRTPVEIEKVLSPGFDYGKWERLSQACQGRGDLMLVGHEPDFSQLVRVLTGGKVKMAKAGLAALEREEDEPGARLLWLFPPEVLIRLYA